jgi:hypothetical protein
MVSPRGTGDVTATNARRQANDNRRKDFETKRARTNGNERLSVIRKIDEILSRPLFKWLYG